MFLSTVFNEAIVKPLTNLLVVAINFLPGNDFGLAIILVTILSRALFYPLSHKALKSQKELAGLQPKIKEIQNKHKNNREEQSKAIMGLYKEHKINPFSGCVPIIVQLPLLIGLYKVLLEFSNGNIQGLYSFVSAPEYINTLFLGIISLTQPSLALAICAGVAQFMLSKITFAKKKQIGITSSPKDFQNIFGKQMMYVFPFITVVIARTFPAGLALYWFITTLFSFGQQYIINKHTE